LAKWESRKLPFFTHFIIALPEFNQSLLDFINLFDLRLFMLLYDSLNLVINALSLGLLGGMVQRKGSQQCCSS